MQTDRVLITCEALGLHHVQATQASSSHIVIDLVALLRVPSRTCSNSESVFFLRFFAGDSELALGTFPVCAGRNRPHTYPEGCNKVATTVVLGVVAASDVLVVAGTSSDRVLSDSSSCG